MIPTTGVRGRSVLTWRTEDGRAESRTLRLPPRTRLLRLARQFGWGGQPVSWQGNGVMERLSENRGRYVDVGGVALTSNLRMFLRRVPKVWSATQLS